MPSALPASRSDQRRSRTRAALITAGRRLFAERDAAGVSIQEITDTADVAKGSFYNHFASREELQQAAAKATLEELGASLDRSIEQREDDPARIVAQSLLATLRACIADASLGAFILQNGDVLEFGGAILMRGHRDLERGRRSGRFEIDDLKVLLAALAGAGLQILRGRLRGELGAAAEPRFIALAMRMLGLEAAEAKEIANEAAARQKRRRS